MRKKQDIPIWQLLALMLVMVILDFIGLASIPLVHFFFSIANVEGWVGVWCLNVFVMPVLVIASWVFVYKAKYKHTIIAIVITFFWEAFCALVVYLQNR